MKTHPALAGALRAAALALLLGAGLSSLPTAHAQATAHPPERMTYQGFLVDGNGTALGNSAPKNYDVIFRIWSSENGSSAAERLWTEQQTVTVDKGYFSVLLGEGTPITGEDRPALSTLFKGATASDRYVGVTVKGIGNGGANVDILPRLRLLPSPYAFLAEQATKLVRDDNSADLITSSGNVLSFGGHLDVLGNNSLEFGVGIAKQVDAGRIGYQLFGAQDSLDIVGAGTTAGNRKVRIYAEGGLNVTGPVTATGFNGDGSGLSGVALLAANNVFTGSQRIDGSVGIGAGAAYAKFRVLGSEGEARSVQTDNREIKFRGDGDTHWSIYANKHDTGTFSIANTSAGAHMGVTGTVLLAVKKSGRVGINNSSPLAPLHVSGGAYNAFTLEAYLDVNGAANTSQNRSDLLHSIIADNRIRAGTGVDIASDARIKTVLGESDGASDLRTLSQIRITDYRYKDTVEKGSLPQKKVIAQQVESVMPNAVTKVTDVVPDIFRKAAIQDGWVELDTDLKKGDVVRLVADKSVGNYEVTEVAEGKFRTEFKPEGGDVFVYGRQVSDFRVVDYEAIAMLNVSATQELARRLERQEAELAELRAELARARGDKQSLAENLSAMDERLARMEALLKQQAGLGTGKAGAEVRQARN